MFEFEKLGQGCSREVYVHPFDPSKVIKAPRNDGGVADNEDEYAVWLEAGPQLRKSLAPVVELTDDGYLVMERVQMIHNMPLLSCKLAQIRSERDALELPPELHWDVHPGNYGVLDGRVVMHDYARTRGNKSLTQSELTKIDSANSTLFVRVDEIESRLQLGKYA